LIEITNYIDHIGAGKNFFWWKGSQAQLVVYETEQIKVVLNNKDGNYLNPEVQPYLKKLFGDGLVTTRGEKWFKLRKVANHAFHGESFKVILVFFIFFHLVASECPSNIFTRLYIKMYIHMDEERFAPSVVSCSSPVVAHMMTTGGLHGR
jgi:PHYB activation tagged suppressor 1